MYTNCLWIFIKEINNLDPLGPVDLDSQFFLAAFNLFFNLWLRHDITTIEYMISCWLNIFTFKSTRFKLVSVNKILVNIKETTNHDLFRL